MTTTTRFRDGVPNFRFARAQTHKLLYIAALEVMLHSKLWDEVFYLPLPSGKVSPVDL